MINSSRPLPAPADQLTSVLSTIAAQARRTNLVRAAEIRAALEHAGTAGLSGDGWGAAQRSAHQLAGSAGTFGYGRASELARSLEQHLAQLISSGVISYEDAVYASVHPEDISGLQPQHTNGATA